MEHEDLNLWRLQMKKSLIIIVFALVTVGFIVGMITYNKSLANMMNTVILEETPFEDNNIVTESPMNETPVEVMEEEILGQEDKNSENEVKEVPNLYGLSQEEAENLLNRQDFQYEVYLEEKAETNPGLIFYQRPKPKDMVSPDEIIHFSVSKVKVEENTASDKVSVPNVMGKYEADAKTKLESLGLNVRILKKYSVKAKGTVIAQSESSESKLERGSTVVLSISIGEEEKIQPKPESPKPPEKKPGDENDNPPPSEIETPTDENLNEPGVATPTN